MGYYVLGVHRSGTSAATRVLALLVGDVLEPGAVDSNPRGQWERWEMRHHLDRLLLEHGSTWDHPPPADVRWTSPPVRRRVRRNAARSFARLGTGAWVWKDPRLCPTLSFWLALEQPKPRFVIVTRHPLEVAGSLAARDGRSTEAALALWERSARALLIGLAGRPGFVVPHRSLVTEPETTVQRLATWLGDDVRGDPNGAVTTIGTVVDESRRSCDGLTPEQRALWDLLDLPTGPASLPAQPPPESASTPRLLGPAPLVRRLETSARCYVRSRRDRG